MTDVNTTADVNAVSGANDAADTGGATAAAVVYPGRDLRQREIVPPAALAACHALVVGVGAVGR